MADTICCKDGSREVIFGDPAETLRRIILEKIGEDAERLFVRLMSKDSEN